MTINLADTPFLKIPAIGVKQPIGEFFLCSIPAAALLEVAYSIPATMKREGGLFSGIFGNQRIKSKPRAKQIGAYIDENDSTFPNTIILSVNYRQDGQYEEDEALRWHATKGTDGYSYLTIPTASKLASIIDGQHRLEGFKSAIKKDRLNMELPCAIYINLPRPYQARIFATININQKRVDKSLAYELFGYDLNESNSDKWPPDMLGVYLARALEGQNNSPFKDHIRLALLEEEDDSESKNVDQSEKDSWQVSVACLVEGITRLISEKPQFDQSSLASGAVENRAKLPHDNSPLRQLYIDGQNKTLLDIVIDYFKAVEHLLWNDRESGSFIVRTVGVLALFDVLLELLKANKLDLNDLQRSTLTALSNAQGIDFSDDYFHASGAGRVRIRNVLKVLLGLLEKKPEDTTSQVVERLVLNRVSR